MKQTIIILLIAFGMKAQVNDSLISFSEKLKDTTLTVRVRCDNKEYKYLIENREWQATFTLLESKKLYTDWRKIGGVSYFVGGWAALIGHGYIKEDKIKHFAAGYGISMASSLCLKNAKNKEVKSTLIAILAGVLKETVYDKLMKKGTPSVMDAVWTGAGGYYGSITIPMIKTKPVKPIIYL
jgi:hypothetical protein